MPRTKPGMKSTLLRQWKMLRMIPRLPRKIGTADLMQKLEDADFNIDLRTIQRDLNQLSEVLPLTSDQAKPQGWAWKEAAEQFDIPRHGAASRAGFSHGGSPFAQPAPGFHGPTR